MSGAYAEALERSLANINAAFGPDGFYREMNRLSHEDLTGHLCCISPCFPACIHPNCLARQIFNDSETWPMLSEPKDDAS